MASQKIRGRVEVRLGAEVLWITGDWTYTLGVPTRKELVDHTQTLRGYYEEPKAATLAGTIIDHAGVDLAALLRAEDATITLDLGVKRVVFHQAFQSGSGEANAINGEVKLEFIAAIAEEIV